MSKFFTAQTPHGHPDVRVSAARPELLYYRGYDCVRTSEGVIHVWKTVACCACQCALSTLDAYVRTKADMEQLQRNGLNLWSGAIPPLGRKPHSEVGYFCSLHYKQYLEGMSLEELGELTTREIFS